jgi:hypothetical protein
MYTVLFPMMSKLEMAVRRVHDGTIAKTKFCKNDNTIDIRNQAKSEFRLGMGTNDNPTKE